MNTDRITPSIADLLDDARRALVETGARNRLIHVNRETTRSNSLNIINERTHDVFDLLRVQGTRMRFLATGQDDEQDDEELVLALPGYLNDDFDPARYRDKFLETALGPEKLERRLLRLFTDARTAEEEQGFNILYLALGFLKWFESTSSDKLREAPLVLVPVQLVRSERRASFDLIARDEDIVTNLPLQERLRSDFGIELPEIEDDEDWRPNGYLADVESLVSNRQGWSVDIDGIHLGFFSFAKLLMMRDLDPDNWEDGVLEEDQLIRGLLAEGFTPKEPLFNSEDRLDERLDPADIVQVIDADTSQTKVIEEIRSGRNLVVQGPPGTGKSQTIANIIAGAVHDGKTVLFMAEKMAALDVVHARLKRVGLGDLCLELHSRTANKRAFIQEIERTLMAGRAVPDTPGEPETLRRARDRLNEIVKLLHDPIPGYGFTPFSVISEIIGFVGRRVFPPQLNARSLLELGDLERLAIADRIKDYVSLLARAGPRHEHPFVGVGSTRLQPPDLQRLMRSLPEAVRVLHELQEAARVVCEPVGLDPPDTLDHAENLFNLLQCLARRPTGANEAAEPLFAHIGQSRMCEALAAGRAWRMAKDEAEADFLDSAWAAPVSDLRAPIATGVGSFWARCFGKYRRASAELAGLLRSSLPKSPGDRLALVDRLIDVQNKRKSLANDETWLRDSLGPVWRGDKTDFVMLASVVKWLEEVSGTGWLTDARRLKQISKLVPSSETSSRELRSRIDTTHQSLDRIIEPLSYSDPEGRERSEIPLEELLIRLSAMTENIDLYGEWVKISVNAADLEDAGLSELVIALDKSQLAPEDAVDEFLYATAEVRWHAARESLPQLNEFSHLDRHELVKTFRDLDKQRLKETRRLVRELHRGQLPTGAYGEMGFLRGEIAKKRRHLPIRRIMQRAGNMVQRIKPVFLMSPISIAQFLPPQTVEFDLLVIDEASQVRPEEALGAIARCRQIAVVGDQKQLPPTSFFDRVAGDSDEDDPDQEPQTARATELESVLTLCEARGLNNKLLEWHYRSRDPSLIAVNNAEFYDHRLILPPSPVQDDGRYGLVFTRVPGVYSSRSRGDGRPGTNRIEADEVAKRLAEHARTQPNLSVGVVAFSKAQSDMVMEVLEVARRDDHQLEALLRENKAESVFVKNIENVQGDERDVILITVGYGPHEPDGRLASMSFGPINSDGGERRLNVLFSRARVQCEVFCSFDPDDIDLSRTTRDGPTVLKRFLEFARSGQLHQPMPTGDVADSPFEEDVANEIRSMGFECDAQVGSAGFRIDLGVRHPDRAGRYILAVECDGATYHGSLWARERDRLRQDVLEGMGWRFHRIWSTDWFHRRSDERKRLRQSLEEARATADLSYAGSNAEPPADPPEESAAAPIMPEGDSIPERMLSASPYRRAQIQFHGSEAPHEISVRRLSDLVARIVEAEGPVHEEEVARRVATAFGLARAGPRIRKAVQHAISMKDGIILMDERFCMTAAQHQNPPVRDRSLETAPTTRADYLSPIEIRAAAVIVERESGRMPRDELITATARLLGFARTGQDVRARIQAALPDDAGNV